LAVDLAVEAGMKVEDKIVTSPLSRAIHVNGKHLTVNVYKGAFDEDEWLFEVVGDGRADVSETMYTSDKDALEAALQSIAIAN